MITVIQCGDWGCGVDGVARLFTFRGSFGRPPSASPLFLKYFFILQKSDPHDPKKHQDGHPVSPERNLSGVKTEMYMSWDCGGDGVDGVDHLCDFFGISWTSSKKRYSFP